MDYITLALAKDYADQVAAGGGSGSADLKNYYKKSEVDNKLNEKVDKIEGKSLSTNDYTTEEKTKLASLENYNDEEIKASIALKADTENVYSKTEIDERTSLISGYKGTVANESKLPTENLVNGDVYRLEDTNTNVMYKSETYSISNGSKIKTITFPEEVVYDENVDGKTIEFKSEDGTVLYTCTYQDEIKYLSRLVTLTCGDLFTVVYTKEVGTETFGKIDGNDTYTFDAELNVNSTFNSNIPFVSICNKGWETLSSDMNLSAYYTKPELENLRGFPFLQKVWYDVDKESITTTDPSSDRVGSCSVALGDNTFAEGARSFAMGAHSQAFGDYSVAMGNQARTNTDNGCAIGEYVMTQAKNQTALGCYNVVDSNNLFIIGNGTNESSRSNAHTLSKNGVAWFEGDIYTGSTSGTNKDEGSVRLAKITELNTKVDKVEGKDLSSNDFTDDLKTKLEGLSNYNDTEIKTSLNSKANSADVYTKSEVDNKVSSIYKYKGSVANKEALPTENLTIGDVYNLEDTGMNVAYTGEKWDELGSIIDLNNYYTKTETITELTKKVDKVEGKGLSTNDFTDDLNTKLVGIAAGAEVNAINTVKLNGEALTVTDKSVNIEVPIPQAQSCDVPYDAGNLPISVVNGANGFTQNQKSFSAIASSGTTYETTITVNKENISTIVLSASLAQHNSDNQTSTKFIETGCVAKIEFLYQGQSQTIKEVSTIGQSVLIEGAINGMQIKLTLQCSDNSKNVMFKVNIENYCINETLNNTLTISDSGDMYLQNILKQKTAELQTQIDWINNDTSKDIQVVPLYDTQASANLTMLNNTEYRIETHSGTSTLNINFEEGFETVDTATYKSVLILRTGTNDNDSCTVTVPDGVILQGDDVTNNTLTTQKLKVYEISFNWHGFMMIGLVKGFSYPAPLA